MKKALLLLIYIYCCYFSYASEGSEEVYFFDTLPKVITSFNVDNSIYIGELTEQQLKASEEGIFNTVDREAIDKSTSNIFWVKLEVMNKNLRAMNGFLFNCTCADTIKVYSKYENGIRLINITGNVFNPEEKAILTTTNLTPISLQPNHSRTFFIRYFFKESSGRNMIRMQKYVPQQYLFAHKIKSYALQYFYLGCMMLICFVAVLMYFLFKDSLLLYFGSFMFFLGLYFPKLSKTLDTLLLYPLLNKYISLQGVIISGIIISAFLFFSHFTRIKESHPTLYRIYFLITFIGEISMFLVTLAGFRRSFVWYHNLNLLLWVIVTFITIILYARKGGKSGKTLLISVFALFVGAILYILSLLNLLPNYPILTNSFQIGSLLFSAILFYILFDRIKTIQEEQKQGKEINKIKSNFFANISHELRTPLTLMLGPIEQAIEGTSEKKQKQLLQLAAKYARRQLNLVNQLLTLSKLESGKLVLNLQTQDLISFTRVQLNSYESLASKRNISLIFHAEQERLLFDFDIDKMEKILTNLIGNAINHSLLNGKIELSIYTDKKHVTIKLKDDGKGIPKENISKIFDRFYSTDTKDGITPSTGIGLEIVKELVELHGGTILVESVEGEGTEFLLIFEKKTVLQGKAVSYDKTGYPEELFSYNIYEREGGQSLTEGEKKFPLILLIEDNEEIRAFIKQRIEYGYRVIEAADGKEGILKAKEFQPDLVISDVMMPERDGYEVCEALKKDVHTSHIPVILLTAKTDQQEIIAGYENGADAYIIKPFNNDELQVRIKNLIDSRKTLRKLFSTSVFLAPEEITASTVDNDFIKKAISIVESNLTNEQLNVAFMAGALAMSKANLNRKFRVVVDMSTNQFVQSIRLKKAAERLTSEDISISEVAFQTGFSSSAYFIKCFKTQFGVTPKEYTNNRTTL